MDEVEKEYKKMSERISESREAMQVNVSFVTNTSWVRSEERRVGKECVP